MGKIRIVAFVASTFFAAALFSGCSGTVDSSGTSPSPKPSATAKTPDPDAGTYYQIDLKSGLRCTVLEGYEDDDVDCDLASWTTPEAWASKIGVLETKKIDPGFFEVSRFTDGKICVSYEGYSSVALQCVYPPR